MGNFIVRYASRVVIYDHRAVIRFATGLDLDLNIELLLQQLLKENKLRREWIIGNAEK